MNRPRYPSWRHGEPDVHLEPSPEVDPAPPQPQVPPPLVELETYLEYIRFCAKTQQWERLAYVAYDLRCAALKMADWADERGDRD